MKFRTLTRCSILLFGVVMLVCVAMSLSSCDKVFEHMDPCPQGLRLRFVYDYNMEFANAFPSQVDCITLLVYDNEGRYISTHHADKSQTSDENWRMEIELPKGDYNLIAYGGLDCADASFKFVNEPSQTLMKNLEVYLPSSLISSPKGKDLHPLFYGFLQVSVLDDDIDLTDATVMMMKDTNNLRIILQNVDGTPVNNEDFSFTVTADNLLFNYKNEIIPTASTVFFPWIQGTEISGSVDGGERPVQVGYAEFSLSRFMATATPRLEIKKIDGGRAVLSIPLINYLLLLKSQQFESMKDQEFLDRESRWNMIFFLDGNSHWVSTHIVINNWIVRINNIDDFD